MNAKRTLAALLAALMLISCAACSESAPAAETTAASSAAPETTVPTVTETTVDPNAPLDRSILAADPLGSYTGVPLESNEKPIQDADDL